MSTVATESLVAQKTRELCEAIVNDSAFTMQKRRIDAFMADDSAKAQYQSLAEKGEHLNHKQQQGVRLDPNEIADYEKDRDALVANPIAAGFIEAQREMHKVQEEVNQYISKTLELGRVPSEEDMSEGGCGSGCGCHH